MGLFVRLTFTQIGRGVRTYVLVCVCCPNSYNLTASKWVNDDEVIPVLVKKNFPLFCCMFAASGYIAVCIA